MALLDRIVIKTKKPKRTMIQFVIKRKIRIQKKKKKTFLRKKIGTKMINTNKIAIRTKIELKTT